MRQATPPHHPTTPAAVPVVNDSLVPRAVALRDILCIAASTAWRLETLPDSGFPKPVKIGARVFYRRSEIDRYLAFGLQPAPRTAIATVQRVINDAAARYAANKAKVAKAKGTRKAKATSRQLEAA